MNEANAQFNSPDQPESDGASVPKLPDQPIEPMSMVGASEVIERADASDQAHLDLDQLLPQIFDASSLDDMRFEESPQPAFEIEALPAQTLPVSANLSSIAAWSNQGSTVEPPAELLADPSALPSAAELAHLIQELNQCNSILMERVSQLEEALESSQNALQTEVGRTQDVEATYTAQDWLAVQEQITTLFNQLEFAHQTNQRQQILIETVTEQLENSQERVAQLEREAALLQQRYDEQTQLLAKSEASCRDLQSRLQRQQRYTLQFKAALEKSLEVPTPQYETGVINLEPAVEVAAEAPFLPKARRIEPWSAQHGADQSPWMKLHQLELPSDVLQNDQIAAPPASVPSTPQINQVDLPSFGSPFLQILPEQPAASASQPGEIHAPDAVVNRNLAEQAQPLMPDPKLKQQLDEVVKPLADLLAEALLSEPSQPPAPQVEPSSSHSSQSNPANHADQLLAATMADAEDALWQDLARLIDVSTEDVVKASLSGDLAAFESINFAALPPEAAAPPSVNPPTPLIPKAKQPPLPPTSPEPPAAAAQEDQDPIPAMTGSSWPSPVVYPLRPAKKRQSLAMVDLPTFPKSGA